MEGRVIVRRGGEEGSPGSEFGEVTPERDEMDIDSGEKGANGNHES